MELVDFLLFPLYVGLFYLIFLERRKRIQDPVLKKYHKQGFWIKVLCTIPCAIFNYYIATGDSLGLYYDEGVNIAKLISQDSSNIILLFSSGADFDPHNLVHAIYGGYFRSESNYFVIVLVAVFSFFSFSSYLVLSLIFSMISYSGVWRLYKFFYEQYPKLHKHFAIALLFLPSFVFWNCGILKDPLCISMLGWMTYSFYCALYKKESVVKNLFLGLASGYILGIIKPYILFSYLPFFAVFLIFSNFGLIQQKVLKYFAVFSFLLIVTVGFFIVDYNTENGTGQYTLSKISESVIQQQTNFINLADVAESSFSLGVEFDGTDLSLIKMIPAAIAATFFRPFLWESKKISTLIASLESMALIIFTLFTIIKVGPFNFIRSLFINPLVMFCFFFSIVFAIFVGSITLNFGTLVRYKLPCIPFYIIALMLINEINKKKKKRLQTREPAYSVNYSLPKD